SSDLNGVVQGVCLLVEAAGLCLAYTGVDGWEQGKNQALACVVCWGDVGQVGAHNSEVWKSFAYCWKLACGLCWIGLKSYISHDYDDTSVFASSRSEEHTSELQSRFDIICRLLLEIYNTACHTLH